MTVCADCAAEDIRCCDASGCLCERGHGNRQERGYACDTPGQGVGRVWSRRMSISDGIFVALSCGVAADREMGPGVGAASRFEFVMSVNRSWLAISAEFREVLARCVQEFAGAFHGGRRACHRIDDHRRVDAKTYPRLMREIWKKPAETAVFKAQRDSRLVRPGLTGLLVCGKGWILPFALATVILVSCSVGSRGQPHLIRLFDDMGNVCATSQIPSLSPQPRPCRLRPGRCATERAHSGARQVVSDNRRGDRAVGGWYRFDDPAPRKAKESRPSRVVSDTTR